eukprot:7822180-Pyramimonas_sp.AAC.1
MTLPPDLTVEGMSDAFKMQVPLCTCAELISASHHDITTHHHSLLILLSSCLLYTSDAADDTPC